MFSLDLLKWLRTTVALITVLVLIFGFFCADMVHKTSADSHNSQVFGVSGQTVAGCCSVTSPADHLGILKNNFLTVTRDFTEMLAILAASFVLMVVPWKPISLYTLRDSVHVRYKAYIKEHFNLIPLEPLKIAFSSGVLHSKAY